MQLVLLETTGKQAFIFETGKLRQNLGASQMILESTTRLLTEVLRDVVGEKAPSWDANTGRVDLSKEQPIKDDSAVLGQVEVIIATSGKAMLLVDELDVAEAIVWEVTARALACYPGIRVVGVVEEFEWGHGIGTASAAAHRRLDYVRAQVDSPRFLRLPVNEDCALSGAVAAGRMVTSSGNQALSHIAQAKELARHAAIDRMRALDTHLPATAEIFDRIEREWLAVVHADGNGLGAVFSNFDAALRTKGLANADDTVDDRKWVDNFRALSTTVEEITAAAFSEALGTVTKRTVRSGTERGAEDVAPVVPIVLGGDDLTVVCPGSDAWAFTTTYLDRFAQHASENEVLSALLPDRLTASAGIAIVKPHFPFVDAYRLAEELAASAKTAKPEPAIDFHVLQDSNLQSLADVRSSLTVGTHRLYAGPYRTDQADRLKAFVNAISRSDTEGRRVVSNTQLHRIRSTATRSPNAAEAEWAVLRKRTLDAYPDLDGLPKNLFDQVDGEPATMLCDALTLADVTGEVA